MRIFNNKDVYVISNGLTLETDNKNGSAGSTFEAALRVVGKFVERYISEWCIFLNHGWKRKITISQLYV